MSELAARVEELAPHRDRLVVVHCHHGGRSLRVARWLREQGFPTPRAWPAASTIGVCRSTPACRGIEERG